METISQWIAEHITEPLQQMIIDSVNAVLVTFMNSLVDMLTGVLHREAEFAGSLLENSYITQAVAYSIGIAVTLLAVRIAFEAFQTYIAYSSGQENHPGELLKKAAVSVAAIVSTPWIVKQVLVFCFSIIDDIAGFQAVPDATTIQGALSGWVFVSSAMSPAIALLLIAGLLLWLLVLIQMSVRAVNIALLMVVGPFLWAMQNELGRAWFKALLSQCFAIPIQIFILRGALGSFVSMPVQGVMGGMLFVGFMFAALKFPAFLQQLVAQTGVGGMIGSTAGHVGTTVLVRSLVRR